MRVRCKKSLAKLNQVFIQVITNLQITIGHQSNPRPSRKLPWKKSHFSCRRQGGLQFHSTSFAKRHEYRKTPLISTYVYSGLVMVQVLIFGGRTCFRGVWLGSVKNPARKKSVQASAFRRKPAVVHVSAIMHIPPGYRVLYLGYVLSGHCSRQQISEKMRGTYLRGFMVAFD